jgi:hypothetical protein
MPTLSASDYTTYLKFKAAAASPIKPAIQTRDNATLSQSVLNANILASQAAFVTAPATTSIVTGNGVITGALTNVLSVIFTSANYKYTASQPHGLVTGQTITIVGFTGTASPSPNMTAEITEVLSATEFRIQVGASTGTLLGDGRIANRVYYTTSADHGAIVGDIATVTGISTFTATAAPVVAVPSATTFVLTSSTTGANVTDASGVLTFPRSINQFTTVRGLARVVGRQVVQQRSNPDALSTLAGSGTMSSSAIQRPGGLPTGFKS